MTTPTKRRAATIASLALALTAMVAPLAGQAGTVKQLELGLYGVLTKYDDTNLGLDNKFGAGGRIGYYFTRTLSVEASGDFTETSTLSNGEMVRATRFAGTIFANAPILGSSAFYIGAGYERTVYRSGDEFGDGGIHLIVGPRLPVGGRAAFRIEGRATYVPSSNAPGASGSSFNIGASIGLSVFAFGGPPRDADGDGVGNEDDTCPDTPRGADVDAVGCPSDSDSDSVLDGIDECPATPGGADVNGAGCPSDDDLDTVYNGIDICPDTPAGALADENGCPPDSDNDSVFDGIDQCPDTPMGADVNALGCPSDEDSDLVYDGIDQCAGTPAGMVVDATGCAAPVDSDMDGVFDTSDECPNTPAGTIVDARGCIPDNDTDLDGVVDRLDRCPSTAPGTTVDNVGCPVLFVVDELTQETQPLILQGVNFATGRSTLTEASFSVLNVVAMSLMANPDVRIQIGGHTDAVGSLSSNMSLSLGRAEAVRAYMARQGVPLSQMETRGYGPDRPIATNSTADGRAQNRRVELTRMN